MEAGFARPRINGSKMNAYLGQEVCLLGTAKDVDNNGMFFTLVTSDGKDVKVTMQQPLGEYVAGLVEVCGNVNDQNSLSCDTYILFPDSISSKFDMDAYNQTVEMTLRNSKLYMVGVNL